MKKVSLSTAKQIKGFQNRRFWQAWAEPIKIKVGRRQRSALAKSKDPAVRKEGQRDHILLHSTLSGAIMGDLGSFFGRLGEDASASC